MVEFWVCGLDSADLGFHEDSVPRRLLGASGPGHYRNAGIKWAHFRSRYHDNTAAQKKHDGALNRAPYKSSQPRFETLVH